MMHQEAIPTTRPLEKDQALPSPKVRTLAGLQVATYAWPHPRLQAPALLFAHANGFNANTYQSLLNALAPPYHIMTLDWPGHGQSPDCTPPLPGHSHWLIYRDILKEWSSFSEDRPVLVGHSMGAVACLSLLHHHPDAARAAVLIDPVVFPPWFLWFWKIVVALGLRKLSPPARKAMRRRPDFPSRAAAFIAYQGKGAFRTWPNSWLKDYLLTGLIDREDGSCRLKCSPRLEAHNFASLPHQSWTWFRHAPLPLTVVVGEHSDAFPAASRRCLARMRPDIRLVCVPKTTHFVPMEAPDIVIQEVLAMS